VTLVLQVTAHQFGLLGVVFGDHNVCAHAADRSDRRRREVGSVLTVRAVGWWTGEGAGLPSSVL
jgi:hypothetical protein